MMLGQDLAGDADDFADRLWTLFEDNLDRYRRNESLVNVVDKQAGYVRR